MGVVVVVMLINYYYYINCSLDFVCYVGICVLCGSYCELRCGALSGSLATEVGARGSLDLGMERVKCLLYCRGSSGANNCHL